jgi:uncharacterized protein YijF (DUF1287 family)
MKRFVVTTLAITGLAIASFIYYRHSNSISMLPLAQDQHVPLTSPTLQKLMAGGIEQTEYTRSYDPAYVAIAYPGGDVSKATGVCTDVVIRAFRQVGVDLQKEVHEDMQANFSDYPQEWGLTQPDPNIDHRRVPNLMQFFKRNGKSRPITRNAADYKPGDVVAWDLGGGNWHIGLVTNVRSNLTQNYKIVHNIGSGARVEDILLTWTVIGHYRYF